MSRGTVLFAAGGGGSPSRHQGLIGRLQDAGFTVIAPEFAMLAAPRATVAEMEARIAVMAEALASADAAPPLYGVGHSLGAALLIGFAGADMWHGPGLRLPVPHEPRLLKIAALAPPLEFFGAPGAAEKLAVPLLLRSAGEDCITTTQSHEAFVARLRCSVDFTVQPDAGHFSYMDVQPPGAGDALADSMAFRDHVAGEIIAFLYRDLA